MTVSASKILMVRPILFGFNDQTSGSNSFQNEADREAEIIQGEALREFDAFVLKLRSVGIETEIFEDTAEPHTPDSIFPNNWISFHGNVIVLYPMLAENRRKERRQDIVSHFRGLSTATIDLTGKEKENIFLEGTGSIVFDYEHRLAYANISPRTNKTLLQELCQRMGYSPVTFRAVDSAGADIYHTNVLMCIGNSFAVLCADCIPDKEELEMLKNNFEKTGHELILINYEQMNSFAGNMYQLFSAAGQSFIIMSEQAYLSLNAEQKKQLEKHGSLLHSALYTIEKYGGGSARCMMADVRCEM